MSAEKIAASGETTCKSPKASNGLVQKIIEQRALTLLITIVLLVLVLSLCLPYFASFDNMAAILLNLSLDGIICVGMMICMVGGFFDLSVGSNVALSGAITAYCLKFLGLNVPVSIILGLAASSLGGFINGVFTAKVGVNALITTLATMGIMRGFSILVSGAGITFLPESFTKLGQTVFLGLQSPVWVMFAIALAGGVMLAKSRYLRQFYYVGGNEKAATLSGINSARMKIVGFMITGFLAGVAGVLQAARLGTAMSTAGIGQELRVITAVIIGGASLNGGKGTIAGALLGALFMALVNNAMIIAGVSVYWQSIVIGIVLLAAVSLDVVMGKKSR